VRGISLHIGLNRIDPSHYGTDGWLAGAENDANAMQQLAVAIGYRTSVLLTASARADAILATIRDAASQLTAGIVSDSEQSF
jgi:metacaspase-1